MDVVVPWVDENILEPSVYKFLDTPYLERGSMTRDALAVWFITSGGGAIMYFVFATLSYLLIYDKSQEQDKRFLKHQKLKEIGVALSSIPIMGVISLPFFVGEVWGYSRLYHNVDDWGVPFLLFSIVSFLLFTDCLIYWIHRGLHYRWFYSYLHKPHHWWKVPTPYASHAFHPIDGFLQSFPYHVYVYLFPLHKWTFIALFIAVNFWTISIHDGDYRVPPLLAKIVNGAAHHTVHHLEFNYNYGQFFTLWDIIGGSYRKPEGEIIKKKKTEKRA